MTYSYRTRAAADWLRRRIWRQAGAHEARIRAAIRHLDIEPSAADYAAAMAALDRRLAQLPLADAERRELRLRLGAALDDRADEISMGGHADER